MAKTEKEKRSRIKKVEELSDWMILMPDSAKKTLIPQLAPLHRYLLKKSLLYYRWHLNPYAQLAHWLSLFGSIFLVFIIIFTSIPLPVKAEAKVWDGGGPIDDWSDPLNWSPVGVPAAGDSVTFNDSGADENVNIDILGAWGSAGETITITGDAGATDGYDGTITQNVAIPGMGAFAMTGADSVAVFTQNSDLTVSSLSVAGGTFTGGGAGVDIVASGSVSFTGGVFNDPATLTISDDFTLAGATYNVSGTITLSDDWTFTSGAFGGSPSVTFNDSGQVSTIAGSTTFQNFISITLAKQITFTNGTTQTISALVLTGGAGADQIVLRSTSPGDQWSINPTIATVSFVDTRDSNNTNGTPIGAVTSTNSGQNTNWNFVINIAGIVTDGGAPLVGATIQLAINGAGITSAVTGGGGAYDFAGNQTVVEGDSALVYIDDNAVDGNTVAVIATTTSLADLNIQGGDVIAYHSTAGPITNANFDTAKGGLGDADIIYSVAASNLTLNAGVDFVVFAGDTYTPGGNLTATNVTIQAGANFNAADGSTVGATGNWSNLGTFTPGSSTVVFNGAAGQTIDNSSSAFWNLTVNNSAALLTVQLVNNNLDIDGNFYLQDGGFDSNGLNQNYAGNVTFDAGTTYTKGGTITFDGAEDNNYTDSTAVKQNIGVAVVGGGAGNELTLASSMTVDTMTVNRTLDLASNGYILNLAGTVATVLTVTGTLAPGTNSTVQYSAVNGGGNVGVTTTTYNSVRFSGVETYVLAGHLTGGNALTGSLTIDAGGVILDAGAIQNYNITLAGNWASAVGTFIPRLNTVTFSAGAGTQTINNVGAFWHLTLSGAGTKQLLVNNLSVNGDFALQGGIFDANGLGQDYGGSIALTNGTTYTKGGIVFFNMDNETNTYADNNDTKQNLGAVIVGSAVAASPEDDILLLGSDMLVDTMLINTVLQLASNGYTLRVANDGAVANVLTFGLVGVLTPGTNSTVQYSALNSGGNINVTTTTYNSIQLSGAETYVLTGNLTGANALTGGVMIDAGGATLDTVAGQNYNINLAGNWSNAGTFTARSNTVNFTAGAGTQDLNSGGVGAGNLFNNFTHSGAGTLRLITNAVDIDGDFSNTAGIFNANGQNIQLNGNWANSATFTAGAGTVSFDRAADTQTLSSGGVGAGFLFNHLTHSGAGTLQLINNDLDVDGNFLQSAGTFDSNALNQSYAGNFTLDIGTTYAKGGIITFNGAEDNNYTDSTAVKQNIGTTIIGGGVGNELTLASSMTVDTMDIVANNTLDLASNGYTLDLQGNLSIDVGPGTVVVLRVNGVLAPGTNSTVRYSGVSALENIGVTTTTYNSVQLSGAETYVLTGNLTGANSLTGGVTIDAGGTILDAVFGGDFNITLAGNWSNAGTFSPRAGLVEFNAAIGVQTLNSGGVGAGFLFNHLTHSGVGTLRLITNDLDVDGNFLQSAGTFDSNALNQSYAGNFTLDAGTTYTKGATITFDGAEDNNYTDSTAVKQNIGAAVIGGGVGNELTLASSMTLDTMTINRTLDLASNGYILNLANIGAVADVLTITGTLTPGTNSTVQYSATNGGGNVNVLAATYNSIRFSGDETYVPTGHLTGANALTGSLTIDGLANFNANGNNITLAGNWTKTGIFSHGNNTVTFNDVAQVSTITGNSAFWNFVVNTPGKTLSFGSGSTQTVLGPASWTIAGVDGNHITLLRSGGAGNDFWFINPANWNVDYVTVSNSTNMAALPIDPTHFTDNGNNVNWFPAPVTQWCAAENAFIPQNQWTNARCDVPGGGSGPVNRWCESEQRYIPRDEWTEQRCAPPATRWCEAEQSFIPEQDWTEQRCVPAPSTVWCEDEQRFIPQGEWTQERCVPSGSVWCELEQHYIPQQEWTESRCAPPGFRWCEAEQRYVLEEDWTEGRCVSPVQKWCKKEQRYIPEQEWTERRCVTDGARWCEVEQRYMPEEEWTEARCVPPGTRWCEIEQAYIPQEEWTEEGCVPVIPNVEEDIFDQIEKWLNSPLASKIVKAVAVTGLVVGGAGIVAGFLPGFWALADWILRLLRLLSSFMVVFGLKRKSVPWGTVYDSITKQPLDPAYVMLQDAEGKEVTSSITDLDGRYGFLAEPGKYTMVAHKTNYKFPSRALFGRSNDEIYNNLYFGGEVEIAKKGDVIARDIPLDREKFDWNEFAKKQKNLMKFYSQTEIIFRQLADILFVVGFASAIANILLSPDRTNFIIVVLYIVLGILISLNIKTRMFGLVLERGTGLPLSFAILRVFGVELDKEMMQRVANKFGRYYILVPRGSYYLRIDKKNDDGSYSHIFTSKIINAKSGVIQKKFVV